MLSQVMQNKLERIKGLIRQFNDTLNRESEIDAMAYSGEYSAKSIRELREDLDHEQKKIEEKIGKVWNALSGKQQCQIFIKVEQSDRWIFDGF